MFTRRLATLSQLVLKQPRRAFASDVEPLSMSEMGETQLSESVHHTRRPLSGPDHPDIISREASETFARLNRRKEFIEELKKAAEPENGNRKGVFGVGC